MQVRASGESKGEDAEWKEKEVARKVETLLFFYSKLGGKIEPSELAYFKDVIDFMHLSNRNDKYIILVNTNLDVMQSLAPSLQNQD